MNFFKSKGSMEKNSTLTVALLGALLGISHALAQCTMMGISGLNLDPKFILSESIIYILAGIILGLILQTISLMLRFFPWARSKDRESSPSARPGWLIPVLILYFAGMITYSILVIVFRVKSYSWQDILPVLAASVIIFWGFMRFILGRQLTPAARVISLVTVSFLACGTSAYLLFSPEIISENGSFLFALASVSPFLAGVVLILAIGKLNFTAKGWLADQKAVFGAALPALLIVNILAWFIVMPCRARWFVFEYSVTQAEKSDKSRPNILLIVFDTLRADYMELFGCPDRTMPFVADFARENSTEYKLVRTHSPWTLPSHACIFTGTHPARHGAHWPFVGDKDPPPVAYPLGRELPTLAQLLARLGYSTSCISANYGPLGVQFGLHRGFGYYDARPGAWYWILRLSLLRGTFNNLLYRMSKDRASKPGILALLPVISHSRWEPPYRRADEINNEILSRLKEVALSGKPYFLFANFMDPHFPYLPPKGFNRFFHSEFGPDISGMNPTEIFLRANKAMSEGGVSDDISRLEALYKDELLFLDSQFESLFRRMQLEGFLDNTLIILTSDHGEAFGEHGFLKHGDTLYENQLLVPFIIRYPESLQNVAQPLADNFQHIDLLPTLLKLLGAKVPAEVEGLAFGEGENYTVSEVYNPSYDPERKQELKSLADWHYKYIRSSKGEEEFYDLQADAGEQENILAERSAIADSLKEILDIWEEKYPGAEKIADNPLLRKEDIEKLRSLGYVK